jgi:hypothetical protein
MSWTGPGFWPLRKVIVDPFHPDVLRKKEQSCVAGGGHYEDSGYCKACGKPLNK